MLVEKKNEKKKPMLIRILKPYLLTEFRKPEDRGTIIRGQRGRKDDDGDNTLLRNKDLSAVSFFFFFHKSEQHTNTQKLNTVIHEWLVR